LKWERVRAIPTRTSLFVISSTGRRYPIYNLKKNLITKLMYPFGI